MSVSTMNGCSHPKCDNYSDIAATPCSKCDELMEGYPKCSHCGQPGGMM